MTSHGNDPLTLLLWFSFSMHRQHHPKKLRPQRAKKFNPLLSCGNGDVIASPDGGNGSKKFEKLSKFCVCKLTQRTFRAGASYFRLVRPLRA